MALFSKVLHAKVMTTELLINSDVSKRVLYESLSLAKEFEQKYSAYKEDSLLSQINRASGVSTVKCDKQDRDIFQIALKIAQISDGKFDPTIGVLTQGLYGFGKKNAKIPTTKELENQKKLVNYKNIQINEEGVFLTKMGMKLDLGGIGKGYVADKIIEYLLQRGATRALVSVGGEICSFGKKYNIAIKDPFSNNNIAIVKTTKKALTLSTSGDYERYIGSKENHHILESKSAKQKHYYSSVTLIKNGIDATTLDGVATIVFNSPQSELAQLAEKFSLAIIAMTPEKRVVFENFKDVDVESLEIYPFS